MFDIHSHLLPNIDDGSDSLKTSENALLGLKKLGFEGVAFTPHFYPSDSHLEKFIKKRKKAFESVINSSACEGLLTNYGAEVYLSYTLFNLEDLSDLCFKGTNTILIEPKFEDKFSIETEKKLAKLVNDYPVVPILAHIDRYPGIIGKLDVLSYLREMGYLFQINISSLDRIVIGRKVAKTIKYGFCDFLGNDLHRSIDPQMLSSIISKMEKKFGTEFFEYLDRNAKEFIFI